MIADTHICIFDDYEYDGGLSLSTRNGREAEVLGKIEAEKGFTVFWATENQKRACAITRLEKAGRISRIEIGQYPWCPYKLGK